MSSLLRPFTGFVPSAEYARRVVGPPSSMLTREQKMASSDDELSFRHVVGRGANAPFEQAMQWLELCKDLGALQPVADAVLVHRIERGPFRATGMLADVLLDAYDDGLIKRHEATIAKTQRKMVSYMESTRIFGNPVALAHRSLPDVSTLLDAHTQDGADVTFEAIDGATHSLWVVPGSQAQQLCDLIDDQLYITDGHHRLAAAAWLASNEGRSDASLPAAVFDEDELVLGAYARSVVDDSVDRADLIELLSTRFAMREVADPIPRPLVAHEIAVRIAQRSFLLTIPPELIPSDVYDQLDVTLLQDLILEPMFGITDPRTDRRLGFAADTTGVQHDVDACTAWFLPFPTSVPDVMAVADSGRAMPPKSTYFLPKVPSGLLVRPVDAD